MNIERDEFSYSPPESRSNASVQIGFEPSPHLRAALQRFFISEQPEDEPNGDKMLPPRLRITSLLRRDVIVEAGDGNGFRFIPDQARELSREAKRLLKLHGQQICLGRQALVMSQQHAALRGIQVRMSLRPTAAQRHVLAGGILNQLATPDDVTIYTAIPPEYVASSAQIDEARESLEAQLRVNRQMFVQNPYVTTPRRRLP